MPSQPFLIQLNSMLYPGRRVLAWQLSPKLETHVPGVKCVLQAHPVPHFSPVRCQKDNSDTARNFQSSQVPGGEFVNRFCWL